jgi:hypothetical protein
MDKITIDREELVRIKMQLDRVSNSMEHILPIIDSGLTDEDRPWILMLRVSHSNCLKRINQILGSRW